MASSRIGTPTNLSEKGTYDLLMVKTDGKASWPEGQLSFGIYETAMKITGVQKIAQHFLRVLLTSKGSDPFYPEKGTYFSNLFTNANILEDENTLRAEVVSAVSDACKQTRAMVNPMNVDKSSTLNTVEVIGFQKVTEGWFIAVELVTLAGESASIAVPFPEFGLTASVTEKTTTVSLKPPVANFVASVYSGEIPLEVNFFDTSANFPSSWVWDFTSSGAVDSTLQNPSFIYTTVGKYTVTMTATNEDGSDTIIKTAVIEALPVVNIRNLTRAISRTLTTCNTAAIEQVHILYSSNSTQTSSSPSVHSGPGQVLTSIINNQFPVSGTGAVEVISVLVGEFSAQGNNSTTDFITQDQFLVGANSDQGAFSTTPDMSPNLLMVGANSTQNAVSGTDVVTANQVMAGLSSAQSSVSGTAAISRVQELVASSGIQSASSSTGIVDYNQGLVAATSVQSASSTTGVVGTNHSLVVASSSQGQTSSTGTVSSVAAGETVLLMHFDGANGSTTFTDSSASPVSFTPTSFTISTAQSKAGGSSGLSNNTGYLVSDVSSKFNIPGDFTIEMFVRFNTISSQKILALYQDTFTASSTLWLDLTPSGKIDVYLFGGALPAPSATLVANTWYYIALSVEGATVKLSIDGVVQFSNPVAGGRTSSNSRVSLSATNTLSSSKLNGYIDEVRITRGKALDITSIPSVPFTS